MLLGGEPGQRFSERYRRTRHVSALRKPLAIAGGSILIVAGAVLMLTPGPGALVMLAGAMLIASESRRAAQALDRLELAVRAHSPMLACGVAAPLLYIGADSAAASLGAPASGLVGALFTVSSLLYAGFAFGVWPLQRAMACTILASAIHALVLWNFAPAFTDTMHAVLAINPFVVLTMAIAVAVFRGWFRAYTVVTIVIVMAPATPWLGIAERVPQYAHHLWHAALAIVLLVRGPSFGRRDGDAD